MKASRYAGASFGDICRFCGSVFASAHPSEADCVRRLRLEIARLPLQRPQGPDARETLLLRGSPLDEPQLKPATTSEFN